jgi:hypothetical protein
MAVAEIIFGAAGGDFQHVLGCEVEFPVLILHGLRVIRQERRPCRRFLRAECQGQNHEPRQPGDGFQSGSGS